MSGKFVLGNMISAISNQRLSASNYVVCEYSKLCWNVLGIMRENGYIKSFSMINKNNIPYIKIFPEVYNNKKTINKIILHSTPGSRVYRTAKEISYIVSRNKYNTYIYSTSQGVISSFDAVKRGLGGEFLCELM